MSGRRRAQQPAGASRIRPWSEAPALATWTLDPLESAPGVTSCEHLEHDGDERSLAQQAAFVPQIDRRVVCETCITYLLARFEYDDAPSTVAGYFRRACIAAAQAAAT